MRGLGAEDEEDEEEEELRSGCTENQMEGGAPLPRARAHVSLAASAPQQRRYSACASLSDHHPACRERARAEREVFWFGV